MRVVTPDPDDNGIGALAALVAELRTDVAALGRGLATVTAALNAGTTPGDPDQDTDEEEKDPGQRDWLTVTDPITAREWLHDAATWTTSPGQHLGIPLTDCWTLHPSVVVDVLAAMATRATAYRDPSPTPVAEWLTRWLPATRDRITRDLTRCADDKAHHADGGLWDTTRLDIDEVATWWATDRDTRPAPQALHLAPR